jgi:hypothetical protein
VYQIAAFQDSKNWRAEIVMADNEAVMQGRVLFYEKYSILQYLRCNSVIAPSQGCYFKLAFRNFHAINHSYLPIAVTMRV